MNEITEAQVLAKVERAFGDGAERNIASAVLSFLTSNPRTEHVSLQLVRQLVQSANRDGLDATILRTLQFLSGEEVAVLAPKFEIFDDSDFPQTIGSDVVREALLHRMNPITGNPDPDIEHKIFLYFSPIGEFVLTQRGELD